MERNIRRNYGIDFLRVISTFMIVILHILGNGSVLNHTVSLTLSGELLWAIKILSLCAVDCYALISGYVGINTKHKYKNIISLSLQVSFYAVIITGVEVIIAFISGNPLSLKTLFFHLLPSIKNYWYFSAYFCLYFLMPVLDHIVDAAPRDLLKRTAIFILFVFCCLTQFGETVSGLREGYSVFWLSILYVAGRYIAKYDVLRNLSIKKSIYGYLICCAIMLICKIAIYCITSSLFGYPVGFGLLITYTAPTTVLSAIFLLSAFSKLSISNRLSKAIAFVAPTCFGIYIVHCHPYLLQIMTGRFAWISTLPFYLAVPALAVCGAAVFLISMVIDRLRMSLFRVCRIDKLSLHIEQVCGRVVNWISHLLHCHVD